MTADIVAPREDREVEWQLAAPDLASIRRWLAEHAEIDGLSIEPCQPQQLHDVYLDTDDWRIFRAGYALRTRSRCGETELTLKSLHSQREDAADRRELSEAVQSPAPDAFIRSSGPVTGRVRAVAGRRFLRALFEVRNRRERFAIRSDAENEELGEIALDEGVILRPGGEPQAAFQRIEVEALGERLKPLERLVARLRAECALDAAPQSKYELGLRSVGLAPVTGPRLTPVELDASMRASELALAALRRWLDAWFAQEPGARLGDDPERLHDLRAAARRLDATLGLFAAYLPRNLVRSRQKVKTLLRVFGDVRDLDVQLAALARFSRSLPEADRRPLAPLHRFLEAERRKARSQMLSSLDSQSTRSWLESLTRALAQIHSTTPRRDALAVAVAPELIDRGFRKLRKAYRKLAEDSPAEEYHAARGHAKKLRDAIEAVAALYGKPADKMMRRLRRLQDELGSQHDAYVAQQRLLSLASDPPEEFSPRALFLMGRFAEQCARTGADTHRRIRKAWRKARGRRWKAFRSCMREVRERSEPAHAPAGEAQAVEAAESTASDRARGAAEPADVDATPALQSARR